MTSERQNSSEYTSICKEKEDAKKLSHHSTIPTISGTVSAVENETCGCTISKPTTNTADLSQNQDHCIVVTMLTDNEILTVDNIQITYDITNKHNENYKYISKNFYSKTMKIISLLTALVLFGLAAKTPNPFSCFVPITKSSETSVTRRRECNSYFVQFLIVLLITAAQLIALVPDSVWPVLVTIIRVSISEILQALL